METFAVIGEEKKIKRIRGCSEKLVQSQTDGTTTAHRGYFQLEASLEGFRSKGDLCGNERPNRPILLFGIYQQTEQR